MFSLFILVYSRLAMDEPVGPRRLCRAIGTGGFGSRRAWMNTLSKAAPLILTALCTALPARLGLIIIGNEGALVLGGLAAAAVGVPLSALPFPLAQLGMLLAAMGAGAVCIALCGGTAALARRQRHHLQPAADLHRHRRLRLPGRRPAARSGQPEQAVHATPSATSAVIGTIPGLDVHWGLVFGIVACVLARGF